MKENERKMREKMVFKRRCFYSDYIKNIFGVKVCLWKSFSSYSKCQFKFLIYIKWQNHSSQNLFLQSQITSVYILFSLLYVYFTFEIISPFEIAFFPPLNLIKTLK